MNEALRLSSFLFLLVDLLALHNYEHELLVWRYQDLVVLRLQAQKLQLILVVEILNSRLGLGSELRNQPGEILS